VPSRRIVNTSPLILPTRTGRLDSLRLGGAKILDPDIDVDETRPMLVTLIFTSSPIPVLDLVPLR
jgi:hypothetical protein